ncbi:RCC1 domain-containing protein [Mesoterricola silvestris]|uniref:RCC1-like domain-containing protein n=1 Tax=Mesoterricola silvestris TaxID=2927979 RepID=A0AA48K930_9BACT|nr:hypothetical protein [Mesoterricola silvestris]BDU73579.1 hypothetical protein METEAL_27530 [Mesoterricola silvestris]
MAPLRLGLRTRFALLALLAALAGCGSSSGGSPTVPADPSISAFSATPALLTRGATVDLTATYRDGTGTVDHGVGALASAAVAHATPQEATTYTLTVTGNGKTVTRTASVDVVAPPVQPVVQAAAQATEGQTALAASVPAQNGCTFAWTLTSGTVTAGQGTAQITFTAGAPGSLGISCVATNAAGTASAAGTATCTVVAAPRLASFLATPAILTLGDACGLTAQFSGGTALLQPGGIALTSGQTVQVTPTTDTHFTVTVTNPLGVSTALGLDVQVVAPPVITAFSAAGDWLPMAQGLTLSATFSGGTAVVRPGNRTILSGTALPWTGPMPDRFELAVTNAAGRVATLRAQARPRRAVALGRNGSWMLKDDGTLWVCGQNATQMPMGYPDWTPDTSVPTRNAALTGVVSLVGNQSGALALKADGTVWHLEANGTFPAALLPGLPAITSISSSGNHNLALAVDGTAWAWGSNFSGELGDGTTTTRATPAQVLGLPAIEGLHAGSNSSFAFGADGTVWGWGSNYNGQLARASGANVQAPVQLQGLPFPASLALTGNGTFALDFEGRLWAWGNVPGSTNPTTVTRQTDLPGAVRLVSDSRLAAALALDGTLWTWGPNYSGSLGTGDFEARSSAFKVALGPVLDLATDGASTLALLQDGTFWTWGDNSAGQLGDTIPVDRTSPVDLAISSPLTALAASTWSTAAVTADGGLWLWGQDPRTPAYRFLTVPTSAPGFAPLARVAMGLYQGLAQRVDGSLWRWGWANPVSADDGFSAQAQVTGLGPVAGITSPGSSTFFVLQDGTLWAQGNNSSGNLGDGSTTTRPTPVQVTGLTDVRQVAASSWHTLALDGAGRIWAWGDNSYAQLGDGTLTSRTSPALVPGFTGVTSVSAGSTFSAALLADGTVSTWGWLQPLAYRAPPAVLPGSANTRALAAGQQHLLTLQADGTVRSIGNAGNGQTGQGTFNSLATLTAIPGLTGVQGIASSGYTSFAWGATFAKGWGQDAWGSLGLGRIIERPTPGRIEGHTAW